MTDGRSEERHAIAVRLKLLREKQGLGQKELAAKVGLERSSITAYETEKRFPKPENLGILADFFKVSADYLLGRDESSTVRDASLLPPGAWPVGQTVKIPVVGVIRAGRPILAEEHIEGWEDVPADDARDGEYIFLRVRGDSMEPQIHDGYMVLVRLQPDVDDGQIAVVMANAEEATLKRVYRQNGHYILKADNPKYPPILVKSSEARVIGKVVQVRFEVK